MDIKPNCYYETRSGLKARIYAVDGQGSHPLHGAILYNYGWTQEQWYSGGNYFSCSKHQLDIVDVWTEPEPKLKAYIHIPDGHVHLTTENWDMFTEFERCPHLDET